MNTHARNSNKKSDTQFFLSSFPRSGNTWVRFLIANVYNNIRKGFDEIDFYNIHEIIPEYRKEEKPFFNDFPKVFKIHHEYKPLFKNTILLLRNPFDILTSYLDLLTNQRGLSISLAETAMHEKYGIKAIVEHTDSYIKNCENLLVITYENLHNNSKKELRKIFDFLDFNISDAVIEDAVNKSSFPEMDRIERQKGKKVGKAQFKHIRYGKIGTGLDLIRKNEELYHFIIEELKKSPVLYLLYS